MKLAPRLEVWVDTRVQCIGRILAFKPINIRGKCGKHNPGDPLLFEKHNYICLPFVVFHWWTLPARAASWLMNRSSVSEEFFNGQRQEKMV